MRKTNEGRSPAGILLPAAAAGLAAVLLLMFAAAVLTDRGLLAERAVTPCAFAFLALGSAAAAFLSAKRAPGGRFLWAVGAGALVFLILLLAGFLLARQPVDPFRTVLSLLCTLAASAVGGFGGASVRKKNKHSHLKK